MACGDLIQSSVLDCDNPIQGGVGGDSRLVLISKADILTLVQNGTDQITAITLVAGKSAFSFDGIQQSLKPKFERIESPSGQSVYKHTSEFFYFEYSQVAKNNAKRMANGRYLAIYENAKQDVNSFEMLGLNAGLRVTEMMRGPQENGGAMKIILSSPENEFEGKPPQSLTGADYAAIKTLVDALLFLPTIGASGLSIVTFPGATPTAFTATGTNFFGGGTNNAVLKMELVNNLTGAVVPWTATLTVTATTVAGNTPVAAVGNYKVRITTIKGVALSAQNIIAT